MKILSFADIHFHSYQTFSTRLDNGLNSRFVDCLNAVEQIQQYCVEQNIRDVVFAGDMFKSRTKLDVDVFTEAWKVFRNLADVLDNLVLLCGNHDQYTKVGDIHCLDPFRDFASVVSSHAGFSLAGLNIYCIAHVPDYELLKHYLSLVPYETDILFMHQPVAEAIPGPTDNLGKPKFTIDDIDWGRVKKVISGDIHKRQDLAKGKWHYVGSPLQLTFGERGQTKGASIIDTDTLDIEQFVVNAPTFHNIDLPDDKTLKVSDIDLGDADPKRDFIRLRYTKNCDIVASKFKDAYPRAVVERLLTQKTVMETEVTERVVGNDRALLEEYTTANRIPEVEAERLLEFGLMELLTESD